MQASRIAAPPLRQVQDPPSTKVPIASRAKSMVNLQPDTTSLAEATPKRPTPTGKALERKLTHRSMLSNGSSSSGSSLSSEPGGTARFPSGPSTTAQVMEALRHTHDQYLSTIAAFIGHAHSHSRTSHASSTGHMFDLVREVVEMVCKLLTIVEAVMHHPEISTHDIRHLKAAKEGLYNVTSSLAESVRLLTVSLPSTTTEEDEKASLLRSATGALKAGADCVAAVKMCLNRSTGERKFIVHFPEAGQDGPVSSNFEQWRMSEVMVPGDPQEEDLTVQPRPSSAMQISNEGDVFVEAQSSGRDGIDSKRRSIESVTMVSDDRHAFVDASAEGPASPLLHPSSPTEDGTMWHGTESTHHDIPGTPLEEKILHGDLPSPPPEPTIPHPEGDPASWMLSHNYLSSDVAYNNEGHLVGATMEVLVEKMTPHDSIVDPAFAAVFFLTFRLFSAPNDLVTAIITRYNLPPPQNVSAEDYKIWEQRKAIPVRLRVSNFIKLWLEMYWRPTTDNIALAQLMVFTRETIAVMFSAPALRIMELIHTRLNTAGNTISPKGDRLRDPGMSLNPPSLPMSEVPRPTMTKTLLSALRSRNFTAISITDFDALELARQMTIMECNLYCQIQPEEVLETGQAGATAPLNVRAVSTLSTTITGWVAESILNEQDIKKRQGLVKFFIKVADVSVMK
jgi:son of sevenless